MQSSSLVFLVIIAIWAAYLLQHWVRRREHLATARSVDRFSAAMRVLHRRTLVTEFDLSAPPRSYAVSPARPSRPEVVVKRPQSLTPKTPNISMRPRAAVRPTRVFHVLAGVSARLGRGLSLLVSLLLTIVVSSLAGFRVLPWWSVPAAVAVLVADVAWLRHKAVSERAARQARAVARESGATPAKAGSGSFAMSLAAAGDGADSTGYSADGDQAGWAPVPVPPPTYNLKAKAARLDPEPAAVTETTPAQPSRLDDPADDRELDERLDPRRAAAT